MVYFFHYYIITYPLFGIRYVPVRRIPCSCSVCGRKLASLWNRSQDKYNQHLYKDENQNFVYWPIPGSYKNCQIIQCIKSRNKSFDYRVNVHECTHNKRS